jgi:hypothetical protein
LHWLWYARRRHGQHATANAQDIHKRNKLLKIMARHQPDLQSLVNLQMVTGASGTSRPQYRQLSKIQCILLSSLLVFTILFVDLRPRLDSSGLVSSNVFSLSPADNATLSFPSNFHTHTAQSKFTTVSCPSQIASRNVQGVFDPNQGMDESPKRLTITDPPFWVSLHKENYDRLRWVSIMNKGSYYETGITEQFHQILANATRKGLVLDIGMNIGWVRVASAVVVAAAADDDDS